MMHKAFGYRGFRFRWLGNGYTDTTGASGIAGAPTKEDVKRHVDRLLGSPYLNRMRKRRKSNPLSKSTKKTLYVVGGLGLLGVGGYFLYRKMTDVVLQPGAMTVKAGMHRLVLPHGAFGWGPVVDAKPNALALNLAPDNTKALTLTATVGETVTAGWTDSAKMLQSTVITFN